MSFSLSASGLFGGLGNGYIATSAASGHTITFAMPSSSVFSSATPSATGHAGFGNFFGGNIPGSIIGQGSFPSNYFPGLTLPASSVFTVTASGFGSNRPLNSS